MHAWAFPEDPEPSDYNEPIDAAIATALRFARIEEKTERWVRTFLKVYRTTGGFSTQLLPMRQRVEAYLALSWEKRYTDATMMYYHALAGGHLAMNELTAEDCGGEKFLWDVRCRAVLAFANALRVGDKLEEAEGALRMAFLHHEKGTGSELLLAELYSLQGVIAADRRTFEEAQKSLDTALAIYRHYRLPHLQGRTLINKGQYYGDSGQPEKGLPVLRKGLTLIDAERDPDLELAARFNLASFTADLGRYDEARKLGWGLGKRFSLLGQELNEYRVRWLEGKICFGLGEHATAEREYQAAYAGFKAKKSKYLACIVSLELAVLWRFLGRWEEAHSLMREAMDYFYSLHLPDYLLASMILFQTTFELRRGKTEKLLELLRLCQRETPKGH